MSEFPFTWSYILFTNQTDNLTSGFKMTHVTKLAKASIYCSIFEGSTNEITNSSQKVIAEVIPIIGGDIEGIQAAREIAHCNHKVCLLERKGTIGGHLAISNKTFPTHQSVACIRTPKREEIREQSTNELYVNSYFLEFRN